MSTLRTPDTRARLDVPAKECRVCQKPFFTTNSLTIVCGLRCAQRIPAFNRKAEKAAAKADRADTKRRKEAGKTRRELMAEAKVAVQKFRRLEELAKGSGCMSCGRSQQEVAGTDAWKPGGLWDGGHFMSKGARPELALEPLNIWLQCKSCNGGSGRYARKGYTVNASFETNLIASHGAALVDWLKGAHLPAKHTVDELRAFIALYRAKLKELQS